MTRSEMEARRLQAASEITREQGYLSRKYGVSRTTIWRWRHAVRDGRGLALRRPPGRPVRLRADQLANLRSVYLDGPRMAGFDTARWTQERFAAVVERMTGIRYHPDHVGKMIRRLGLRQAEKAVTW